MEQVKGKTFRRNFTVGEEIGNAITHGLGVLLAIAATVVMVMKTKDSGVALFSALFFGVSMILLYTMSCLYHSFVRKTKNVFERFDHLAIYILIGGSFVPFLLLALGGVLGWVIFIVQWMLIVIGIIFKSIWISKYQKIHLGIYLGMGWSAVFFLPALYRYSPTSLIWLLVGGVSYSIGTLFYANRWFKYHHLVWHFFVVGGSLGHFIAIYFYIF